MPGGQGQRSPDGAKRTVKGERMDATGDSVTAEGRQGSDALQRPPVETGSTLPEEAAEGRHEGEPAMGAPVGEPEITEGGDAAAESAAGEGGRPINSAARARHLL